MFEVATCFWTVKQPETWRRFQQLCSMPKNLRAILLNPRLLSPPINLSNPSISHHWVSNRLNDRNGLLQSNLKKSNINECYVFSNLIIKQIERTGKEGKWEKWMGSWGGLKESHEWFVGSFQFECEQFRRQLLPFLYLFFKKNYDSSLREKTKQQQKKTKNKKWNIYCGFNLRGDGSRDNKEEDGGRAGVL